MNRCFRMIAYAAHCFTRFIGLAAMPSRRERKDECRDAVQRYGRNTAEGQASPSTCAAMVRAWLRQRRNSPSARSQCRRDQGTRAAVALQPSSAACVRRLVGAHFASFASLLLLFKSQPHHWVVIPMRFRTDLAISLQRQIYEPPSEVLQQQGFQGHQASCLGGKWPETDAFANGRGLSEHKKRIKRRSEYT